MPRRKKPSPPGPLEQLPGFWGEATSPQPTATLQPKTRQSSGVVKEATTQYKVTPKVAPPVKQNLDVCQMAQIQVYVGITFDPCQGIREAKHGWKKNLVPSEVVFDCRPLELAPKYASEPKLDELFAPEEEYLLGRGGLLSNAVFINLLRCYGTLAKWSDDVYNETGTKPISGFRFIRPDPNTPVGKVWEVLGMPGLIDKPPRNLWPSEVMGFQSRIVTPLVMVNSGNRNDVLRDVHDWLDYISDRLAPEMVDNTLWRGVCEIVENLVDHGHRGLFGLSVWPSGQIEILWSNPIDHINNWPPDDTAKGLADSLLSHKGGGMNYIYDDLLPRYKGVLIINWKTHNLIFRSAGDFSIMGLKPRSEAFLPRSILFHLHLFCPETRDRSAQNASH
jgi:hypothetical protein